MHLSAADMAAISWYLDDTTLDFSSALRGAGECSSLQLPALANGAAVVLGVALAGAAGAVMARRARRRSVVSGPVQPADQGQGDA
jgi:hypothetical protein